MPAKPANAVPLVLTVPPLAAMDFPDADQLMPPRTEFDVMFGTVVVSEFPPVKKLNEVVVGA